jgi:gamma-D-glutamyl-L-lysine dipeptidyl-peptidase
MLGIQAVALFAGLLPNMVVLKPVANMYSQPSEDARVVSQAIYATNVKAIEEHDAWTRVRTPDDYTGWIPTADLRPGREYATRGRVAEVESLFAHIYRETDVTMHRPLITVPFETKLEVVAEPPDNPRWIEVRLADDRHGWVQSGDISFAPKLLTVPEMLAFSKRFLGLPYTWGGTSSFGYDCSGFTQMLERRRGVLMPRDSQPQANWSGVVPVRREELQPGDLLFFGSSPAEISHTGVYLGEGKFISATAWQTPMVRIDDLGDHHWTQLLVEARRVK